MEIRDELHGLRQLLASLDDRRATVRQNGKDITGDVADGLRRDIAHLERVVACAGSHA